MRIIRLGEIGKERAAVMVSDHDAVFVDDVIGDWSRASLEGGAFDQIQALDLSERPRVLMSDYRIGAPVARPTKVICVGLNYFQHALETGATAPVEPIIFMKAPDTLVGGFDEIVIPPGSLKTDYEVELSVIIGKSALYLTSPAQVREHILGYSISQDVSERHWQLERSGQWMKGKSFPSFNPMGPWIETDATFDPADLRLWCSVDGEMRQDSRTSDLIFGVEHCIWYITQFMELHAGDVINTGTPQGVGMGFKPERYLSGGEIVESGVEGLGTIRSKVVRAQV